MIGLAARRNSSSPPQKDECSDHPIVDEAKWDIPARDRSLNTPWVMRSVPNTMRQITHGEPDGRNPQAEQRQANRHADVRQFDQQLTLPPIQEHVSKVHRGDD